MVFGAPRTKKLSSKHLKPPQTIKHLDEHLKESRSLAINLSNQADQSHKVLARHHSRKLPQGMLFLIKHHTDNQAVHFIRPSWVRRGLHVSPWHMVSALTQTPLRTATWWAHPTIPSSKQGHRPSAWECVAVSHSWQCPVFLYISPHFYVRDGEDERTL